MFGVSIGSVGNNTMVKFNSSTFIIGRVILGEMGYDDNPHFKVLLDYFQVKFNKDPRICQQRKPQRMEEVKGHAPTLVSPINQMLSDKFNTIVSHCWAAKLERWDPIEVIY